MGLYLGNSKKKIKIGSNEFHANYTPSILLTTNEILLTSIDGCYLKSSDEKYLTMEVE